jgi:fructose-1,6-bisphosphatase/inositol monophosphatase family enzyme
MEAAEANLAGRARRIAAEVRARLRHRLDAGSGETLLEPDDLKSGHAIDAEAADVAREVLRDVPCTIRIEGEPATQRSDADPRWSLCIDPVDGSLNWDRGVGDPAFVLAASPYPGPATLDDLTFAYVEGLRSGDRYWTADGAAWFESAATGRTLRLSCAAPGVLGHATGYLRCGYGGARAQLARTLPLFLAARDLRAFDNAGTELCEVARNAAHFLVEARGISDGFNLLAWPIVRAAGGVLLDLEGGHLARQPVELAEPADYVLAGNRPLAEAIVERIASAEPAALRCLDALSAERRGNAPPEQH